MPAQGVLGRRGCCVQYGSNSDEVPRTRNRWCPTTILRALFGVFWGEIGLVDFL